MPSGKVREMTNHLTGNDRRNLAGEMRAKQRNILWPDTLINSRAVDAFLWRGATNPTLVQRIGAWLFGLSFMAAGLGCVSLALLDGTWSWGPIAIGAFGIVGFAVGIKTFLNGWPKKNARNLR